jgi:hypothetical protein
MGYTKVDPIGDCEYVSAKILSIPEIQNMNIRVSWFYFEPRYGDYFLHIKPLAMAKSLLPPICVGVAGWYLFKKRNDFPTLLKDGPTVHALLLAGFSSGFTIGALLEK